MSLKVLLYVRGLEEGGAERQVERLARGLDATSFQTAVAYSRPWGPVGERLLRAGIPVLCFSDCNAAEAESVIGQTAPDIFHSFTHKPGVDIAAARAAGTRMIIGSRVNMREWDEDLQVREWEIVRNRMSHRITAVSHAVASLCVQIEGAAREKIAVIHNGVERPDLALGGTTVRDELGIGLLTRTIGYAANYRPEKCHDALLRSFRLVVEQCPDTHLICCGIMTPETESRLRALVLDLKLESNVSLLHSRSNMDSVYRGLDLYVHASRFEGFSNALLEAMSYALPVVATSVGGTPEAVVNGITGLLIPRDDMAGLAQATIELLGDSKRARQMGQAGRERVTQQFSVQKMAEAYGRLYLETFIGKAQGGYGVGRALSNQA